MTQISFNHSEHPVQIPLTNSEQQLTANQEMESNCLQMSMKRTRTASQMDGKKIISNLQKKELISLH